MGNCDDYQINKEDVLRYLEWATETVRSWPEWEQHLLGPATPEERQRRLDIIKARKKTDSCNS